MKRMVRKPKSNNEFEKLRQIFIENDAKKVEDAVTQMAKASEKALNDYFLGEDDEELATATEVRNGETILEPVYDGDIVSDLFETTQFGFGGNICYPKAPVTPGTETDFAAYRIPELGRIPERFIYGDEAKVDTYEIGAAADWYLKYARQSAVNVAGAAQEALMNGFIQNRNDEGWHVLLAAAYGRGTAVYDSAASTGAISSDFLLTLKRTMTSLGGGNTSSVNRYKATDVYLSQSAIDSIYSWTELSEGTREVLERDPITGIYRIFGLNLHPIDELGSDGAFTNYFTKNIAASALSSASKDELCIAVDKTRHLSAFKNPVRGSITVDPYVDRFERTAGFKAYFEQNFVVLDARPILIGYI